MPVCFIFSGRRLRLRVVFTCLLLSIVVAIRVRHVLLLRSCRSPNATSIVDLDDRDWVARFIGIVQDVFYAL